MVEAGRCANPRQDAPQLLPSLPRLASPGAAVVKHALRASGEAVSTTRAVATAADVQSTGSKKPMQSWNASVAFLLTQLS